MAANLTSKEVWKYIIRHKAKHAFWEEKLEMAVCGVTANWHSHEKWLTNEEGLESKPACKRCVKILRG